MFKLKTRIRNAGRWDQATSTCQDACKVDCIAQMSMRAPTLQLVYKSGMLWLGTYMKEAIETGLLLTCLCFRIKQSIHRTVCGTSLGIPEVDPDVWKITRTLSPLVDIVVLSCTSVGQCFPKTVPVENVGTEHPFTEGSQIGSYRRAAALLFPRSSYTIEGSVIRMENN
jgi:hypothetical protein